MLENWLASPNRPDRLTTDADLVVALERAGVAMARLDQALTLHPLLPAFLYRTRLEAVRRQAAVDGHGIDPWHLAAMLEGLRFRMEGELRIIDRCQIFEAAKTALGYHQWITEPDFDQEGEVQDAEDHLAKAGPGTLLGAAEGLWSWLQRGGARPPIRAALIRHWKKRGLLRPPVPLTGARSLSADAPELYRDWLLCFLDAIAAEADDAHDELRKLEYGWRTARARVSVQRSTSRAPKAVDVLAAAPLLSATTLSRIVGMSIKAATELLDRFVGEGIAVEVTHRSARRLFGLAGMEPMREVTTAPRRPMPGRGPGRPPILPEEPEEGVVAEVALPPPSRFDRPPIDYSALDEAMVNLEAIIRRVRADLPSLL